LARLNELADRLDADEMSYHERWRRLRVRITIARRCAERDD
jgi:hypothetical protein